MFVCGGSPPAATPPASTTTLGPTCTPAPLQPQQHTRSSSLNATLVFAQLCNMAYHLQRVELLAGLLPAGTTTAPAAHLPSMEKSARGLSVQGAPAEHTRGCQLCPSPKCPLAGAGHSWSAGSIVCKYIYIHTLQFG